MSRPARRNKIASLHSDVYLRFVGMLAERRVASGKTQQAVADELGWHQSIVAKIENHQRRIDVIELIRVAEVVGFDPADLIREMRRWMIKAREL